MAGIEEGITYFVPGLPAWVSEEDLQRQFSKYGTILKSVLVKDKGTNNSRRFGYVTIAEIETRDQVCTDVHLFGDAPVRALLTKESLHSADVKKIHLGKLSAHLHADAIRDAFSQFGAVLDVHTPKDPRTGERKNYGFVTFGSEESFDAAIAAGGLLVDGCHIEIRPSAQSKGEEVMVKGKGKGGDDFGQAGGYACGGKGWEVDQWGKGGSWGCKGGDAAYGGGQGFERPDLIDPEGGILRDKKGGIKYFIPGIPETVTDEDLRQHFSQYGDVIDAAVVTEKGTEASRGFGYVTMADANSRDAMLNDKHNIGGKLINILLTKDSLAGCDVKKVHLSKLREDISAESIRDAFTKFGQILDVHTPKDSMTGERKNFGFVTFGTEEAFKAAINAGSCAVEDCRVVIKPAAQSRGDGMEVAMGPAGGAEMAYGGKASGKGFDPWSWDMGKGWDKGYGKGWGEWDPWGFDGWGGKGWGGKDAWGWDGGKGGYGKGFGKDAWGGWDGMWGKGEWGKGPAWEGKGGKDAWSGKDAGWGGKGGKGESDPSMWSGKGAYADGKHGRKGDDAWGGKGGSPDSMWGSKGGDQYAGSHKAPGKGGKQEHGAWGGSSNGGDPSWGKGANVWGPEVSREGSHSDYGPHGPQRGHKGGRPGPYGP